MIPLATGSEFPWSLDVETKIESLLLALAPMTRPLMVMLKLEDALIKAPLVNNTSEVFCVGEYTAPRPGTLELPAPLTYGIMPDTKNPIE